MRASGMSLASIGRYSSPNLSGFSRFVAEFGIIHFLQVIHESRRIFGPCIDAEEYRRRRVGRATARWFPPE